MWYNLHLLANFNLNLKLYTFFGYLAKRREKRIVRKEFRRYLKFGGMFDISDSSKNDVYFYSRTGRE